ncbi:hypothetical protein ACFWIQ_29005 [Kitasatospora sp. NPDC127059]|uniref:hypothetical protein n=1 Tax=unclassified Kitasatospora TaxID=2633591 RepID=UPI00365F55A1
MNEPDADGGKLSDAFERAVGGLGPDLGPLIAAGARQGRSIRRRRRLTIAGAVTAVAALAVGGTVALRTDHGTPAAAGAATASSPASQGPTASPSAPTPSRRFPQPLQYSDETTEKPLPGSGPHTGKVVLTGRAALAALTRALPPGGRTSGYAGHSSLIKSNAADPGSALVMATTLYDDGAGPADVRIMIEGGLGDHLRTGGHPDQDDLLSCAVVNRGGQFRYCSDSVLPDGGRLLLTERTVGGVLSREASLLRPDQARVTVSAINTAPVAGYAKVQVVRDGLPLSLDQLKAAAMSPELKEWITPEEAEQAERTIRPFHDDSPGNTPSATTTPSAPATPPPGSTR